MVTRAIEQIKRQSSKGDQQVQAVINDNPSQHKGNLAAGVMLCSSAVLALCSNLTVPPDLTDRMSDWGCQTVIETLL